MPFREICWNGNIDAFLCAHLLSWAGELNIPFIFRSGGTANPTDLSSMMRDDDMKNSTIVLLRTSYPFHREAATGARLFANLYVGISGTRGPATPRNYENFPGFFTVAEVSLRERCNGCR